MPRRHQNECGKPLLATSIASCFVADLLCGGCPQHRHLSSISRCLGLSVSSAACMQSRANQSQRVAMFMMEHPHEVVASPRAHYMPWFGDSAK